MRADSDNGKPSRDVVHIVVRVLWMTYNSAIGIHRQFSYV